MYGSAYKIWAYSKGITITKIRILGLHLRMLCATAFVPPVDIDQGFEDLANRIRKTYNGDVDDLLDYFEDNYIGRFRRNEPRLPPLPHQPLKYVQQNRG